MRHGEYIALGKIEAILKTCAAVSNIVVYGSGTFIINDNLPPVLSESAGTEFHKTNGGFWLDNEY